MCGTKLRESIQVQGLKVEAAIVQSRMLQGRSREDATTSDSLLIAQHVFVKYLLYIVS